MDSTADLVSQRLGFGCGRLKGGHEKSNALRLVHVALDLGVRHFDTAPPYGLGASEAVLGEALRGRQEAVRVFTKAGLARPVSPGLLQAARAIVKPLAHRIPGLRQAVLKGMAQRAAQANFDPDFIARSLETSLCHLKRDRVDGLLLHEPHPYDELSPLKPLLERCITDGKLGTYGSSTGETRSRLASFGMVLQYRWPDPCTEELPPAPNDIFHGVVRFLAPAISRQMERDRWLKDQLASLLPPNTELQVATGALALACAMARFPNRLLLSTNQPLRLTATLELVRHITGRAAWRPAMQVLHSALASGDIPCTA